MNSKFVSNSPSSATTPPFEHCLLKDTQSITNDRKATTTILPKMPRQESLPPLYNTFPTKNSRLLERDNDSDCSSLGTASTPPPNHGALDDPPPPYHRTFIIRHTSCRDRCYCQQGRQLYARPGSYPRVEYRPYNGMIIGISIWAVLLIAFFVFWVVQRIHRCKTMKSAGVSPRISWFMLWKLSLVAYGRRMNV